KRESGVITIDDLKTRKFGDKIYIDLEISADGDITLSAAHEIAERVHDSIECEMPSVKHCMAHINPYEK
ncbi:MAG: cation-efflux pump, partial [Clostridia bacterium]|nr:cation-efflux pump [Clostridia bacterium]